MAMVRQDLEKGRSQINVCVGVHASKIDPAEEKVFNGVDKKACGGERKSKKDDLQGK